MYGGVAGAILAVIKGLVCAAFGWPPHGGRSAISGILLQLFGRVTTGWALVAVGLGGLCSFAIALAFNNTHTLAFAASVCCLSFLLGAATAIVEDRLRAWSRR